MPDTTDCAVCAALRADERGRDPARVASLTPLGFVAVDPSTGNRLQRRRCTTCRHDWMVDTDRDGSIQGWWETTGF